MNVRAAALAAVFGILATLCNPLHAADGAGASPLDERKALDFSRSVIGKPIGDYALVDRDGHSVRLSRYRGKPLLVSFIYTGCFQVCPTTTKFLAKAVAAAKDALGEASFNVVSIGFNLPFDTPSAMRTFAKQQGITAKNWEFLSPDPATLEALTQDFGFLYYPTPKGYDHLIQVTLVDAQGRVYRQIYGDSFELPMLVAPMKELVTGTPTPLGDLAAFAERVRILCTVYDPASGRYRLNYAVVIELIVGAGIIGFGVFSLLAEWRKHKRTAPRLGSS
ncbi:MAG: SCO family protein [Burkholderiales bacterium]|nr:SCO family protein [Burkholderiales bacterium]